MEYLNLTTTEINNMTIDELLVGIGHCRKGLRHYSIELLTAGVSFESIMEGSESSKKDREFLEMYCDKLVELHKAFEAKGGVEKFVDDKMLEIYDEEPAF